MKKICATNNQPDYPDQSMCELFETLLWFCKGSDPDTKDFDDTQHCNDFFTFIRAMFGTPDAPTLNPDAIHTFVGETITICSRNWSTYSFSWTGKKQGFQEEATFYINALYRCIAALMVLDIGEENRILISDNLDLLDRRLTPNSEASILRETQLYEPDQPDNCPNLRQIWQQLADQSNVGQFLIPAAYHVQRCEDAICHQDNIIAVFDGMGSCESPAAALACHEIITRNADQFNKAIHSQVAAGFTDETRRSFASFVIRNMLTHFFHPAMVAIGEIQEEIPLAETTMTVLAVVPAPDETDDVFVVVMNRGDSQGFLFDQDPSKDALPLTPIFFGHTTPKEAKEKLDAQTAILSQPPFSDQIKHPENQKFPAPFVWKVNNIVAFNQAKADQNLAPSRTDIGIFGDSAEYGDLPTFTVHRIKAAALDCTTACLSTDGPLDNFSEPLKDTTLVEMVRVVREQNLTGPKVAQVLGGLGTLIGSSDFEGNDAPRPPKDDDNGMISATIGYLRKQYLVAAARLSVEAN